MSRCHAGEKKPQRTVGTFKRQQRELEPRLGLSRNMLFGESRCSKAWKNTLWSGEGAVCCGMMPKSKIHSVTLSVHSFSEKGDFLDGMHFF